jgi:hypothetical protein
MLMYIEDNEPIRDYRLSPLIFGHAPGIYPPPQFTDRIVFQACQMD